jgi:hypothetical protein
MPGEQCVGWLGQGVERTSPRVQIDCPIRVETAQTIVKLTYGWLRSTGRQRMIQPGQRAILTGSPGPVSKACHDARGDIDSESNLTALTPITGGERESKFSPSPPGRGG